MFFFLLFKRSKDNIDNARKIITYFGDKRIVAKNNIINPTRRFIYIEGSPTLKKTKTKLRKIIMVPGSGWRTISVIGIKTIKKE